MNEITVVDWISYDEIGDKEEVVGGMGGWFGYSKNELDEEGRWKMAGHRWKDYVDIWDPEVAPYLEALRKDIVKKQLRLTGEQHQFSGSGVPLFSDGKVGSFSYRGWADLMAAVWSEEENKDYGYMDFYM